MKIIYHDLFVKSSLFNGGVDLLFKVVRIDADPSDHLPYFSIVFGFFLKDTQKKSWLRNANFCRNWAKVSFFNREFLYYVAFCRTKMISNIYHVVLKSEDENREKKLLTKFLTDLWPFFDYVFLLALWKCTAKVAGLIELKFSGSSNRWIVALFRKFRHDLTPMADFTGQ